MQQAIDELEYIRDILQTNYDVGDASIEQQALRHEKIASIDKALKVLESQ